VAAGPVTKTAPDKVRAAVVARDGGCRFPGCAMPAAWADCHHIRWRSASGGHDPTNLVLLCRRCHRRVHASRIGITPQPDGALAFRVRGKTFTTYPRARPQSRE
jgi:5-methylcytosine-specific restriction endonuclease McrA